MTWKKVISTRYRNVHCVVAESVGETALKIEPELDNFTLEPEKRETTSLDGFPIYMIDFKVKETFVQDGIYLPKDFEIVETEPVIWRSEEIGTMKALSLVWEAEIYI